MKSNNGKYTLQYVGLMAIILAITGCGQYKAIFNLPSCDATQSSSGATLTCPDGSSLFIPFGEDGANGANGSDGANGTNGTNGTDGQDGANGTDGQDGAPGEDGSNGSDGQNGTDGQDGVDGEDGANGSDGQNGADGSDGIDGQDGADGSDGQDGQDGQDGSAEVTKYTFASTSTCVVIHSGFSAQRRNPNFVDLYNGESCSGSAIANLRETGDDDHWLDDETLVMVQGSGSSTVLRKLSFN